MERFDGHKVVDDLMYCLQVYMKNAMASFSFFAEEDIYSKKQD